MMSIMSENVIPGKQGRIFGTNAREKEDMERIREKVLEMKGVDRVILKPDEFPRSFIVYTSKLVSVRDIEEMVKTTGFHAIPKESIEL